MAELFLEILSEEIPARMQAQARQDLERLVCSALTDAGLGFSYAVSYTTSQRLVLKVDGVPLTTPDTKEERRGPRSDAPEAAIEGFLRGAGLKRENLVEREDKKGTFLYAIIEKEGGAASQVIAEFMPNIIRNFPWPKSQRWGTGTLRWVRPLQSIICLLGGKVVNFEVGGIKSDHFTHGHRFMAPELFATSGLVDYKKKLRRANVVLDHDERAKNISLRCIELAKAEGLEWVEDADLLTEVAGLVEWPVVLMGSFDKAFMEVPEEVLILTMKKDQKYFVTRDPKTGKLAPYFMTVSNIDARNNGKLIIGGNERVLSARLSDAKFFWDQDLKGNLENNLPKLNDIVFHEKLGTVKQRVDRIEALSGYIAELLEWDVNQAKRAAKLCKADLVSNMVNEFPEVQGAIGRYYALKAGEDAEVADAIRDHYAPKGPDDACPSAPVSVAVALAEKIDSLVGFFGADMKPTGSKDPFALRRAALGVIRLIVENEKKFGMLEVLLKSQLLYNKVGELNFNENSIHDLRDFIKERYKVQMRNLGISHDIIDAVYELDSKINLVRLQNIAKALSSFVATDDGVNLLAGYKRAANILRIEEKKDSTSYAVTVDVDALSQDEEKALHAALKVAQKEAAKALNLEDFEGAMSALSKLRAPTDAFFDKVTVNDGNATVRANRLALLSTIRSSIDTVADFSQIEG